MGNIASADRIAEIERRFLRDMVATEDYSFGAARQAIAELHAELRAALAGRIADQQLAAEYSALAQEHASARHDAETALTAAREALQEWMDCAQVDAMMEGPKLKGWNRSQLDRLWHKALASGSTPETKTALAATRKALRDIAITNCRGPWRDQRQWHACKVCGGSWASEDPEQHEGNCPAMVNA